MKVTEFLGKKVLDKNAMEIGKISDMEIDPLKGSIKTVIISKGDIALKQKTFIVSVDDIGSVGDYVILKLSGGDADNAKDSNEPESISISIEK
jgi:sporulation protein YlmC with PRC-barrel domain